MNAIFSLDEPETCFDLMCYISVHAHSNDVIHADRRLSRCCARIIFQRVVQNANSAMFCSLIVAK